jgi:hypothetical protein
VIDGKKAGADGRRQKDFVQSPKFKVQRPKTKVQSPKPKPTFDNCVKKEGRIC